MTVYVVTLVIHVVFMNYVLAGTGYLAVSYMRTGGRNLGESAKVIKEWTPFLLSGAITAGVAPLLFVQILYKQGYYTANLLLFNRWMAILPVLIIGFYALYLLKSGWLSRRATWVASVVALLPILSVAFTGYSWTENHLLSVRDPAFWGNFYSTRAQIYTEPQLLPRLLVWASGSIPTFALILAWQHWYRGDGQPTQLARLAGSGLFLAATAAAGYYLVTDERTRMAFVTPLAVPYFGAACAGLIAQAVGWGWIYRSARLDLKRLIFPTAGLLLTVVGMTVCRESVRIAALGPVRFEALFSIHAEAFSKSGFLIFLAFFVLNAGLIGYVFWLVRHRTRSPETMDAALVPGE